jgi:hypothetical protein
MATRCLYAPYHCIKIPNGHQTSLFPMLLCRNAWWPPSVSTPNTIVQNCPRATKHRHTQYRYIKMPRSLHLISLSKTTWQPLGVSYPCSKTPSNRREFIHLIFMHRKLPCIFAPNIHAQKAFLHLISLPRNTLQPLSISLSNIFSKKHLVAARHFFVQYPFTKMPSNYQAFFHPRSFHKNT